VMSEGQGTAWLDLDGGSIALEPPLQVLIGSAETSARGDAVRDAARLAVPCPVSAGEPAAGALRVLRSGDRIRAAGRIDLAAADQEAGDERGTYRAPRTALRLRPSEDESW